MGGLECYSIRNWTLPWHWSGNLLSYFANVISICLPILRKYVFKVLFILKLTDGLSEVTEILYGIPYLSVIDQNQNLRKMFLHQLIYSEKLPFHALTTGKQYFSMIYVYYIFIFQYNIQILHFNIIYIYYLLIL